MLLTRAAIDAERTARALEALGHIVTSSPVIAFAPVDHHWPDGVVDAVVATSGQAFPALGRTAVAEARPIAPSPEARRLLPLFVVGRRSAEIAAQYGFAGPVTIAPDGQALARAVTAHWAAKWAGDPRARLVYAAGRDRKPILERELRAAGISLETRIVYEAVASVGLTADATRALAASAIDAVLHFSRRSAELFLAQTERTGLETRPILHACLSNDVAEPLRATGHDRVVVAEEPTEASLLATLP